MIEACCLSDVQRPTLNDPNCLFLFHMLVEEILVLSLPPQQGQQNPLSLLLRRAVVAMHQSATTLNSEFYEADKQFTCNTGSCKAEKSSFGDQATLALTGY